MTVSVLIIGRAGRLHDGLRTILRTFPGITDIISTEDIEVGYELAGQNPSVVIIEIDDSLIGECAQLKKLLAQYGNTRCLVIANTLDQATHARQMGADAVLLRGFSTNVLQQTLVSLAVIPGNTIVMGSSKLSHRAAQAAQPVQIN